MRYKRGNGNHDRLTVSLSALEAVDFDPACGGGGAGSDIVEANGSARGKQADREKDKAFELLDKAVAERSTFLVYSKSEPRLDPLRSDPRFKQMLKQIGLPAG